MSKIGDVDGVEESLVQETMRTSKTKKDRSHIVVLPDTNPIFYKCNICEKVFRNEKSKCYHDACATGVRPYVCDICERSFVKRSHFEYHERIHTGYRPFRCTLCDKAFPQKNKLNRHMRSHKNEKEYRCDKCDKCYGKREDLRIHESLHTGRRPHVCELCGKTFAIAAGLNRHARTHSKERPHKCDACGKCFKDRSLLTRHGKTHGKDRPFSCSHCNRQFLSKNELSRHLAIHSDVKPFSCVHCNTIFRRKDNLGRHIRHHHADENGGSVSDRKEKRSASDSAESVASFKPSKGPKKCSKSQRTTKCPSKNIGGSNSATLAMGTNATERRGNSYDRAIGSRVDSLGNITPVIRGPREFSNAVPVINSPIIISGAKIPLLASTSFNVDQESSTASDATMSNTRRNIKTYTYTKPMSFAEAVTINRRIEEKLYPQSTSHANNRYFDEKSLPTSEQQPQQQRWRKGLDNGATIVTTALTGKLSDSTNNSSAQGGICTENMTRYAERNDNKSSMMEVQCPIDNIVPPVIRIENSQHIHETIGVHHWRRRTAESFKSARSNADRVAEFL